jgi:hypothetical protein
MKYSHLIQLIWLSFALASCSKTQEKETAEKKKESSELNHYRLDKPEKFILQESLLEISGIAFKDGNPDTILAINDESGKVFRMSWGQKRQHHTKFGRQGDYEDIAVVGRQVFVLRSNGSLHRFPFSDLVYQESDHATELHGLVPEGEYEGMFASESAHTMYILCKKCGADYARNASTGYVLSVRDSIRVISRFQIDVDAAKDFPGKVKEGFRPSALAQNPVSKEWFFLSSANRLLVLTDEKWRIKQFCHLSEKIFNQPEGIAFDKAGNLYVSNEGDQAHPGNILRFHRARIN